MNIKGFCPEGHAIEGVVMMVKFVEVCEFSRDEDSEEILITPIGDTYDLEDSVAVVTDSIDNRPVYYCNHQCGPFAEDEITWQAL